MKLIPFIGIGKFHLRTDHTGPEGEHRYSSSLSLTSALYGDGGDMVTQSVEALRYKPEGHGFDSQWCHWSFSLT